jgi:hypothetical protein
LGQNEEASVFGLVLARTGGNVSIAVCVACSAIVETEEPPVEVRMKVMTRVVAQIQPQENVNVRWYECEARYDLRAF